MLHNSKKSKKSLLTAWLLATVMLLQLVPALSVFATETAKSGTDGNINWTISDGVLTVSGNGAIRDYTVWSDPTPWFEDRLEYNAIVVEEGVTAIGDYAFAYSSALTSVTLPDSLTYIGNGAFEYCSNLTSITLPENVAVIGEWVFDYDSNLKTVYYEGSEADWNEITLGASNEWLLGAEIVFLADQSTAILGDANGDGAVDAMDAARILMIDAGLVELTEADFAACDVNGDGAVDSMDAARILMFDAGLIEKL